MESTHHAPVAVGDIVDRYRVERVIGRGAMGLVVAARHTTLDQVVAIKFLVEHRFGSKEESIARFLAEARASARIDSDYVCRVSDVGMLPSGVPYMILEHLEGASLEEELSVRGQLGVTEAVDYVLQALDAMAAAHAVGIVHRDLKPANIFLARRPDGSSRAKVLDFGISKATAGPNAGIRETGALGSPAYMAPEQIRDPRHVDLRIDLWALGAILYELLTGEMAFVGATVPMVLQRVVSEPPCPVSALRPDVPRALELLVQRAMERDRDRRWTSAATFARALAPFGSMEVLAGLPSIQREVGSLASISAVRGAPSSAHLAMVASARGHVAEWADGTESRRRHDTVRAFQSQQARQRRARGVVVAMVAVLACASAIAVVFAFPAGGSAAPAASVLPASAPPPAQAELPSPAAPAPIAASVATTVAASRPPAKNVHGTTFVPRAPRRTTSRDPRIARD